MDSNHLHQIILEILKREGQQEKRVELKFIKSKDLGKMKLMLIQMEKIMEEQQENLMRRIILIDLSSMNRVKMNYTFNRKSNIMVWMNFIKNKKQILK